MGLSDSFDPVMTVKALRKGSGCAEMIGKVTSYQQLESHYSIIECIVGDDVYGQASDGDMWKDEWKVVDKYTMWTIEDEVPEGVDVQEYEEDLEGLQHNDEDSDADAGDASFVVSESELILEEVSSVYQLSSDEDMLVEGESFEVTDSQLATSDIESESNDGSDEDMWSE